MPPQATADIGFRFYNQGYLQGLFESQLAETGLSWELVGPELLSGAQRLYKAGIFLARVLDDGNAGCCNSAFVEGKSQEIRLLCVYENDAFKARKADNKLRVLAPKAALEVLKKDAEAQGKSWLLLAPVVKRVLEHFYGQRLYLVASDPANMVGIHEALQAEADVDLKVRLK